MNMKKLLIIIVAGFIIIAIILLVYLNRKGIINLTEQTKKSQVKINKVIDKKVFFPILISKDNKFEYLSPNPSYGFYQFTLNNNQEKLLTLLDAQPQRITWSPQGTKNILEIIYNKYIFEKYSSPFAHLGIQDQTTTKWSYDLSSQKPVFLNQNIDDITWSLNGDKIIYIYRNVINDTANFSLNIANPDGSQVQNKLNIDIEDALLSNISSKQDILIYSEGQDYTNTEPRIYKYNLLTGEKKQLGDFIIMQPAWSPDGNQIYYLTVNNDKYQLWIMNTNTAEKKQIIENGGILKSIWMLDNKNIITAIPQNRNQTYDDFYKINIETGEKTLLFKSSNKEHYSATNLMLSADGKTLYFTSDDYLYKMEIE